MFRHIGKNRTYIHNLKLASLLSLVAGILNVSGLFAVRELTTNVTGHFAFFSENISKGDNLTAIHYLLYTLSFFMGAFVSAFLVEITSRRNPRLTNFISIVLEISLLTLVASIGIYFILQHRVFIACCLLFVMCLQNALVSQISNSVVRTTHLTGMFTDLGIELAQVFFYRSPDKLGKLKSSIKLRFVIIIFFFCGCLIGGYSYHLIQNRSLLIGVALLIGGLIYDVLKFKIVKIRRKYLH